VLGPTRGKGLAICRQHHRMNVKEHQAIIFASRLNNWPLMKFKGNGDWLSLKALKQVRDPRLNHFWLVIQDRKFSFVTARHLQTDIMFGISPVKPYKSRKLMRCYTGHVSLQSIMRASVRDMPSCVGRKRYREPVRRQALRIR